MKLKETKISEARYGDIAKKIWGECEVIFLYADFDYQGEVDFIVLDPEKDYPDYNNKYWIYRYDYGSCSGCDTWEAASFSDL